MQSILSILWKILKVFLVIIASLLVIVLIAALFIKKSYLVERSVTINKPSTEVFEYVKYLKNQDNFSKWAKLDPNMKKQYIGTDATVGFVSSWQGNKDVGIGEQEIKGITEGQKIDYELRFKEPMEDVSKAVLSTDSVGQNQTLVKWNINGKSPYPLNFMCLFMDKMIGPDLEVGLSNLKVLMEK